MVKITEELLRKKAEHHDNLLLPLEELSLHQEGIDKLEHIQNWCPNLKILLLQSNLIAKIENLNKLKNLKYLNLAINNIEKIENLERCESLEKLDLTLNFIGNLNSISNLKDNYNLRELHLMGNPCSDFPEYRNFVIATLPQIKNLDGNKITHADSIQANHVLSAISDLIKNHENIYMIKRDEQKIRLEKEISERLHIYNETYFDEEKLKNFWNEKTEHAPEIRCEIERISQLKKRQDEKKQEKKKRNRPLFTEDGKPYNINQPKLNFIFDDSNPQEYKLDLAIYKYLDTDLLKVDIEPNYIRVTVKDKIFQLCLHQEIIVVKSKAQRSQITGHLIVTMPILKYDISEENFPKICVDSFNDFKIKSPSNIQGRRELLEIGSSKESNDIKNICSKTINSNKSENLVKIVTTTKDIPDNFIDNLDVPPLT